MPPEHITKISQADRMEAKLDRLNDRLYGESGLHVRVDRVEQDIKARKWWTRFAIGAAVAAMMQNLIRGF